MSFLFGGSSSSSDAKNVQPAQFKALQGPLANVLQGLLSGGKSNPIGGIPAGPSTTPAPLGANEQSLLNQLQGYNSPTGITGESNQLISNTLQGNYLPGQPGANPFLDAAIKAAQRPTLEGLTETLTRALPGRFTQAGQFTQPQGSSAFDRAAAIASRGAANSLSDIATNMSSQAYESERGRQQDAVGLQQGQVQSTIQNLQAQALPRLIQEYGIDQGVQQFNTRLNALLGILGIANQTSAPVIANSSQSSSTGGLIPALSGLLGAAFP